MHRLLFFHWQIVVVDQLANVATGVAGSVVMVGIDQIMDACDDTTLVM